MAKQVSESVNVVAIPTEAVLQQCLKLGLNESKRLKLLIRTARDLEQIQLESTCDSKQPEDACNG